MSTMTHRPSFKGNVRSWKLLEQHRWSDTPVARTSFLEIQNTHTALLISPKIKWQSKYQRRHHENEYIQTHRLASVCEFLYAIARATWVCIYSTLMHSLLQLPQSYCGWTDARCTSPYWLEIILFNINRASVFGPMPTFYHEIHCGLISDTGLRLDDLDLLIYFGNWIFSHMMWKFLGILIATVLKKNCILPEYGGE